MRLCVVLLRVGEYCNDVTLSQDSQLAFFDRTAVRTDGPASRQDRGVPLSERTRSCFSESALQTPLPPLHGLDHLFRCDVIQVPARGRRAGMAELTLDHVDRDAFPR